MRAAVRRRLPTGQRAGALHAAAGESARAGDWGLELVDGTWVYSIVQHKLPQKVSSRPHTPPRTVRFIVCIFRFGLCSADFA